MQDTKDLIDIDTARAIADGRHGDPFSVLGLQERGGKRVVTAFVPGATGVTALTGKSTQTPLTPVPGVPEVFAGVLKRGKTYRLRAHNAETGWEFEHAYRFGPVLGEIDEYLLGEGTHRRIWQALGAHVMTHEGVDGVHFAVWAPAAERVSVVGDFNYWDGRRHVMRARGVTGVWEIFIPGLGEGAVYKDEIIGRLRPPSPMISYL